MSEQGAQTNIIAHLRAAQSALEGALTAAKQSSPLTAQIPLFQELEEMKKKLTAAMQQVGKMRGL